MFSSGLKESSATEVRLPFVGPEDFRLILNYAYSGKANATKENVFKMAVMANYFGSEDLSKRCCDFVNIFIINLNNCLKLFEMVSDQGLNLLKKTCFRFIVRHLPEINKEDLSALPVDVLLKIFQHRSAQMVRGDATEC